MLKVAIVTGSTRPGRNGEAVARWVLDIAKKRSDAAFELVDIRDYNLPLLDEPIPPSMGKYSKPHTRSWATKIDSFDAYVFVTPEYNHAPSGALKNAIDYLYREWNNKAAAFVSYGGVSGGLRGVQMAKQALTSLNVMPIVPAVVLPNFASRIGPDGVFTSDDKTDAAAASVLTELARWEHALRTLRTPRP